MGKLTVQRNDTPSHNAPDNATVINYGQLTVLDKASEVNPLLIWS